MDKILHLDLGKKKMQDIAFLNTIGAFFAIDTMLVCIGEDFIDKNLQTWRLWTQELDFSFQAHLVKEFQSNELYIGSNLQVLVYLANKECLKDINPSLGSMLNLVWLFRDDLSKQIPDYLRLDTNWISFTNGDPNGTRYLFEHYAIAKEKKFVNKLGTWSHNLGLNIPEPDMWMRRNDLEGFTLKNCVYIFPPLAMFYEELNTFTGYLADVTRILQTQMNFTLRNYLPPDKEWGTAKVHENGTKYWSGIVGQLATGQADMSSAGLVISSYRGDSMDMTVGVVEEISTLSLGAKSLSVADNINATAYINVFNFETWMVFLGLGVIYGLCHLALHLVKTVEENKNRTSMLYGFVSVTLLFLQLEIKLGNRLSEKTLYLAGFVMCLFAFLGYTSYLTADMTVGHVPKVPKSFQDIITTVPAPCSGRQHQ